MISVQVPGPPHQGARVRSAVAVARSTTTRAAPRERSVPRPRRRCTWGRTGRWVAAPERSTGGRTAARAPASELPGEPGGSCESREFPESGESGKSLPAARACWRRGNGQPPQRTTEVITQHPAACTSRRRQRTHHHQRSAGQRPQPAPHQMAQPALHPMPDHGTAHRATDHKTHPRRRIGVAGPRQMHDHRAACRPAAPLDCRREVIATGQPGGSGQQRRRDPGAGGQADNSRRPLRRRAATMARPARVRIRNRNP